LLLGEIAAGRLEDKARAAGVQTVIVNIVLFAGLILMGLALLLFSVALLPSFEVLLVLLTVVAGLTFLLWRKFIRIYSKAQIALQQTLSQAPPAREPEQPLAGLLDQAQIAVVPVLPDSAAQNKLISEVALRTTTGASIVSIERKGVKLVNPGPDEELLAGDQLLLLGSPVQLEAARRELARQPSNEDQSGLI